MKDGRHCTRTYNTLGEEIHSRQCALSALNMLHPDRNAEGTHRKQRDKAPKQTVVAPVQAAPSILAFQPTSLVRGESTASRVRPQFP